MADFDPKFGPNSRTVDHTSSPRTSFVDWRLCGLAKRFGVVCVAASVNENTLFYWGNHDFQKLIR